jgi:hypothetical protein
VAESSARRLSMEINYTLEDLREYALENKEQEFDVGSCST